MGKRILNIDNGTPPGPTSMNDLLNAAESMWRAGDRQKAFITVLGACALMSQGVAQCIKNTEAALREVEALKAKIKE